MWEVDLPHLMLMASTRVIAGLQDNEPQFSQ